MQLPVPSLAASALIALSLVGCGGADSGDSGADRELAGVVDRLGAASRDGDGASICDDLFTHNLRISVERASSRECAEEVVANVGAGDASYDLQDLTVDRDQATGVISDQADRRLQVLFQRVEGEWRIARLQ